MFDLRYHVASLAAVFIALAVGIVIGVAIASGGGVEDATVDVLRGDKERLAQQLEAAQQQVTDVQERNRAVASLMEDAYPALMSDRLSGKNIALLCLGPIDDCRSDVEKTLTDANAGTPVRVAALELPVDAAALASAISADPALAAFGYEGGLEGVGRGLGREFVAGAETPVWDSVKEIIAEQVVGSSSVPADAIVVVRDWDSPGENASPEEQQGAAATEELLAGVLAGLQDEDVPVVGAEARGKNPSTIPFFQEQGLSTVNDVSTDAGRLALALLLAGAQPGSYGIGDDVDGVTPPIAPLPAVTVAG